MKRLGKYATNRTVRFCEKLRASQYYNIGEVLSINKHNYWRLINILQEYIEPLLDKKKILVRSYYNYHQYDGFNNDLRANPPQHVKFSRWPHFIYEPSVKFIKVNEKVFKTILQTGIKYLDHPKHLHDLFDMNHPTSSITLIYFLTGSPHECSTEWFHAQIHAFGGSLAGYLCKCWGLYCPFGRKVIGQVEKDSRIAEVIFISGEERERDSFHRCQCHQSKHTSKRDDLKYKKRRGQLKYQRQGKIHLTKQVNENRFFCPWQ